MVSKRCSVIRGANLSRNRWGLQYQGCSKRRILLILAHGGPKAWRMVVVGRLQGAGAMQPRQSRALTAIYSSHAAFVISQNSLQPSSAKSPDLSCRSFYSSTASSLSSRCRCPLVVVVEHFDLHRVARNIHNEQHNTRSLAVHQHAAGLPRNSPSSVLCPSHVHIRLNGRQLPLFGGSCRCVLGCLTLLPRPRHVRRQVVEQVQDTRLGRGQVTEPRLALGRLRRRCLPACRANLDGFLVDGG